MSAVTNIKKNTRKLWTLIDERDVSSDIAQGFYDLVESEVDVNLPDANEGNNTAIHFAVLKKDKKCIELLLTLDPDLEIRNDEGFTAEELAKNLNHDEIVQLLKTDSNNVILQENVNEIVDTSESDKRVSHERGEFIKSIQLGSKSFQGIEECDTIKILKIYASPDGTNFDNLNSEYFKKFLSESLNLIVVLIETKKIPKALDTFNEVFKSHGPLIIRFCAQGETFIKECNAQKLTKLEHEEVRSMIYRNTMQQLRDRLQETDGYGDNLLMLEALKNDFVEIVELLLELGIDVSHSQIYSEIANENNYSDCLHQLLLNDSPFPPDFNSSSPEVINLVEKRNVFFEAISSGSEDDVRKYIMTNKNLRIIYNTENKSSLTIALERKKFKIYARLRAQGFSQGIDETFTDILKNLTGAEKDKVSEYTNEFFKSPEYSHILHIMSKTKILSDSDVSEEFMKAARNFLEVINEDKSGKIMLKFLGQLDNLEIVIDFSQKHVQGLDPTASEAAQGHTYHYLGCILIGAKGFESEENVAKIVGVMAHEFLHYILQVIYKNNSNPYQTDDEGKKTSFSELVKKFNEYRKKTDLEGVLMTVFTRYPEELWALELIVRVVQLKMLYKNNPQHLNELLKIECIQELFDFYDKVTEPDIQRRINSIRHTLAVKELNELDKLVSEIQESKIRVKDSKLETFEKYESVCKIIKSNSPKLTFTNIYQSLIRNYENEVDFSDIFIKYSRFWSRDVSSKILNLRKTNSEWFLVVDCTEKPLTEECIEFIEQNCNGLQNTVFVTILGNPRLVQYNVKSFDHGWDDLNETSKSIVLSRKFPFQGNSVVLKDFIEEKMISGLNLDDLINDNLKFGTEVENFEEYFYLKRKFCFKICTEESETDHCRSSSDPELDIERILHHFSENIRLSNTEIDDQHFIKSKQNTSERKKLVSMNTKKFMNLVKKLNIAIISDIAGVGKTTTLRQLSKLFKTENTSKWVELFDLKDHVDNFKNINSHGQDFCDFLCATMMKFKNDFDQKLFRHLFSRGKVILLLDGFDEISPNYKDLLLTQFKTFDKEIGNFLVITTRQHLREDLESIFDRVSCELSPFDVEDQVEFLVKYSNLKDEQIRISADTARELVEGFNRVFKVSKDKTIIGVPLLTRMFAEFHRRGNSVDLNLFSFFKDHFSYKIQIWNEEKGKIAAAELQKSLNQLKIQSPLFVHHQIALNYFFGNRYPGEFQFDENEWPDEKISRVGIISMNNSKPKFNHETDAEFFVADYLITKMNDLRENSFQVLISVFSEKKFRTVRMFLDQGLKNFKNLNRILIDVFERFTPESFSSISRENKMNESLSGSKSELFINIVANFLKEDHETLLLSILEGNTENESLFEILMDFKSEQRFNENILKLNKRLDEKYSKFAHFMNVAAEKTSVRVISKLSSFATRLQRDIMYGNIFNLAAKNRHEGVLSEIFKLANQITHPENVRKMLIERNPVGCTPLTYLFYRDNGIESLTEFLNILKMEFSTDELKENFFEELNRKSPFIFFLHGKPDFIEVYWQFLTEIFKPEGLKKVLLQPHRGHLFLLESALQNKNKKVFKKVLECFKNTLDVPEMMNEVLRYTGTTDGNIFHFLAWNYHSEGVFDDLMTVLKEYFSVDDIKLMLNESCENSGTPLCYMFIRNNNKNCLQQYLRLLKNILDKDELKQVLKQRDKNNFNLVFTAFSYFKNGLVDILLNFMEENLELNEFKSIFLQTANYEVNLLQRTLAVSSIDALMKLFDLSKTLLGGAGSSAWLRHVHFTNRNVFHLIALNEKEGAVKEILKFLKNHFEPQEIRSMLKQKDDLKRTPLRIAATDNKNCSNVLAFLRYSKDVLDTEFLKHLLLEGSSNVFFKTIVDSNESECIETFWRCAKDILDDEYCENQFMKLVDETASRRTVHTGIKRNSGDYDTSCAVFVVECAE